MKYLILFYLMSFNLFSSYSQNTNVYINNQRNTPIQEVYKNPTMPRANPIDYDALLENKKLRIEERNNANDNYKELSDRIISLKSKSIDFIFNSDLDVVYKALKFIRQQNFPTNEFNNYLIGAEELLNDFKIDYLNRIRDSSKYNDIAREQLTSRIEQEKLSVKDWSFIHFKIEPFSSQLLCTEFVISINNKSITTFNNKNGCDQIIPIYEGEKKIQIYSKSCAGVKSKYKLNFERSKQYSMTFEYSFIQSKFKKSYEMEIEEINYKTEEELRNSTLLELINK